MTCSRSRYTANCPDVWAACTPGTLAHLTSPTTLPVADTTLIIQALPSETVSDLLTLPLFFFTNYSSWVLWAADWARSRVTVLSGSALRSCSYGRQGQREKGSLVAGPKKASASITWDSLSLQHSPQKEQTTKGCLLASSPTARKGPGQSITVTPPARSGVYRAAVEVNTDASWPLKLP